jgi:hypothetical protein
MKKQHFPNIFYTCNQRNWHHHIKRKKQHFPNIFYTKKWHHHIKRMKKQHFPNIFYTCCLRGKLQRGRQIKRREHLTPRNLCWNQNRKTSLILIEFEVLRAVVMNSYIFWDIKPCSLLKISSHFRRTCHLHLQDRIICQAIKQHDAGIKQQLCLLHASRWFLAWLILQSWTWMRHVPPKHWFTFNRLHGDIGQKTELFKSNPWIWWLLPPCLNKIIQYSALIKVNHIYL